MAVVIVLSLWSDLSRFRDPLGDKYVFYMPPGAADFMAPYQGARSLLAGEDPYRTTREEFRDPFHREITVEDGARTSQIYPPTHLLLVAPLVPLYHGDLRAAGRAWFVIQFLTLLALGLVTAKIAARATNAALAPIAAFTTAAILLHGGVQLGLERGQSDAAIALLAWGAIALALDEKFARAAFFAVLAALIKGSAGLLALALIACARDRRQLGRALGGAALALVLALAPVARYVPEAAQSMRVHIGTFVPSWYNVTFRSLTEVTTPFAARPLAVALCVLSSLAALLALLAARRARENSERAAWLAALGATTMIATLGAPSIVYTYALVSVLPGTLILALSQDAIAARMQLQPRGRKLLTATAIVMLAMLYKLFFVSDVLPLAPLGMLALVCIVAVAGARALATSRPAPPVAGT